MSTVPLNSVGTLVRAIYSLYRLRSEQLAAPSVDDCDPLVLGQAATHLTDIHNLFDLDMVVAVAREGRVFQRYLSGETPPPPEPLDLSEGSPERFAKMLALYLTLVNVNASVPAEQIAGERSNLRAARNGILNIIRTDTGLSDDDFLLLIGVDPTQVKATLASKATT